MILPAFLVAISLLILLFVLRAARGQAQTFSDLDDLNGRTRPVDIDAFRNLVDPEEEEFLRHNLLPCHFRVVQRERLRAALDYVRCTTHNAAILLRLGEAAAGSADPRIAIAGQQLVDDALRLRVYALLAMARLYLGIAMPGSPLSAARLLKSYQHLSDLAAQLVIMEHPTRVTRFSAIL